MAAAVSAPLYLIDDDTLPPEGGRKGASTRIRVWAGKDRVPVVIASPIRAGRAPVQPRVTTRAADYAFGCLLGFPSTGMVFIEERDGMFFLVSFAPVGGATIRMRHCDPRRRAVTRDDVEAWIGSPVGG